MASSDFVGCLLSVDCGPTLGVYQGRVRCVSPERQAITLNQPFRNGKPYNVERVTLEASSIVNLQVLRSAEDFDQPAVVKAPRIRGPDWSPEKRKLASDRKMPPPFMHPPSTNCDDSDFNDLPLKVPDRQKPVQSQQKPRRSLTPEPKSNTFINRGNNCPPKMENGEELFYNQTRPEPPFFDENWGVSINIRGGNNRRKQQKKDNFAGGGAGNAGGEGDSDKILFSLFSDEGQNGGGDLPGFQDFSHAFRRRTVSCSQNGQQKGDGSWTGDRNSHLIAPLDEDLMATDFDFEANLAMFDKKTVLGSGGRKNSGGAKRVKNFRHDQNIVADQSRVDSWLTRGSNNGGVAASVSGKGLESNLFRELDDFTLDPSDGLVPPKFSSETTGSSPLSVTVDHCGQAASGMQLLSNGASSARTTSTNGSLDSTLCAPAEQINGVLKKALTEVSREFLAGNFASRIMECLWELEAGSSVQRKPSTCSLVNEILGSACATDSNSKQQNIIEAIISSGDKIVILSGPSELSRLCASYLSVHLTNRLFSANQRRSSGSRASQLTVLASNKRPSVATDSDVNVVSSFNQLPKSRETGLVISLWDLCEDLDSATLSPLLAEWIRGAAAAGAALVELDPAGPDFDELSKMRIFSTMIPDWVVVNGESNSLMKTFCVDVGVPLKLLDSVVIAEDWTNERATVNGVGKSEKLSEKVAVMFRNGYKVRVA